MPIVLSLSRFTFTFEMGASGLLLMVLSSLAMADGNLSRRPVLTKAPSTVLDFVCEVPYQAFRELDDWRAIDYLEIKFRQHGASRNTSKAKFTLGLPNAPTQAADPLMEVRYRSDPKDSRVPFLGIKMPYTDEDSGVYYCDIQYENSKLEYVRESYQLVITSEISDKSGELRDRSFYVRHTRTDNITVTWSSLDQERPTIRIYRLLLGVGVDGNVNSTWSLLLSTHGEMILPAESSRALLANVLSSADDGGSYTVSVFAPVDDFCLSHCSYKCQAIHKSESYSCDGPFTRIPILTSDEKPECNCDNTGHSVFGLLIFLGIFTLAMTIVLILHGRGCLCNQTIFRKALCCPKSLADTVKDMIGENKHASPAKQPGPVNGQPRRDGPHQPPVAPPAPAQAQAQRNVGNTPADDMPGIRVIDADGEDCSVNNRGGQEGATGGEGTHDNDIDSEAAKPLISEQSPENNLGQVKY